MAATGSPKSQGEHSKSLCRIVHIILGVLRGYCSGIRGATLPILFYGWIMECLERVLVYA